MNEDTTKADLQQLQWTIDKKLLPVLYTIEASLDVIRIELGCTLEETEEAEHETVLTKLNWMAGNVACTNDAINGVAGSPKRALSNTGRAFDQKFYQGGNTVDEQLIDLARMAERILTAGSKSHE
jgi:hypothetical protein